MRYEGKYKTSPAPGLYIPNEPKIHAPQRHGIRMFGLSLLLYTLKIDKGSQRVFKAGYTMRLNLGFMF